MPSQTNLDNLMLMAAVQGRDEELLEQVRMGADPHAYRDAALYAAAANGHNATVLLLLDMGLDIHIDHDKPLQCAAENNHDSTVKILLLRGADITVLPEDKQKKYRSLVPKTPEELRAEQQATVRVRQTALRNFVRRR